MKSILKRFLRLVLDGVLRVSINLLDRSVRATLALYLQDRRQGKQHSWPLSVRLWQVRQMARFCGLITRNREKRLCSDVIKPLWGIHWSNSFLQLSGLGRNLRKQLKATFVSLTKLYSTNEKWKQLSKLYS